MLDDVVAILHGMFGAPPQARMLGSLNIPFKGYCIKLAKRGYPIMIRESKRSGEGVRYSHCWGGRCHGFDVRVAVVFFDAEEP